MSLSEEREVLLSQLVDGELPADRANEVLADVLKEMDVAQPRAEGARQLLAMLQLRRALGPWRRQQPAQVIVATAPPHALGRASHVYRHALTLAAAALLGGVLVAGGFFLRGRLSEERPAVLADRQPVVVVTPEQRQEIARAFALHESVAGPLSWYAADDSTIRVAPAGKEETAQQPIGVVLRLTRDLSCPSSTLAAPKTYVIVCRNNDAAAIELPQPALAGTVRLRLLPTATNGQVSLQYAIAADGPDRGPGGAALAGRRHVALGQTSLGQLALNNCLVNVDASAWVMTDPGR